MGAFHPQVVHFAIVLLFVGVLLRLISLLGRPAWASPAAATLLLAGTLAVLGAVRSGDDAHGPVERIPGARGAVVEHEEWAERTRNVVLGLAVLELLALALRRSPRQRLVHVVAAVVGLAAAYTMYETAEHGGELVYAYAGGPGIRSGDPQDVGRLLLAGIHHQARIDRTSGKPGEAAALIDEAARRFGSQPDVQVMQAESRLIDRGDAAGALDALSAIQIPDENVSLRMRVAILKADALVAAGRQDEALSMLQALATQFPANTRLKQRISQLSAPAPPQAR